MLGAAYMPPGAAEPCRADLLRGLEAAGPQGAAGGWRDRAQLAELLADVRAQLATEITAVPESPPLLLARLLAADIPALLLAALGVLEFEERKVAARLAEDLLTAGPAAEDYLRGRPQVAQLLLDGCRSDELAFLCGGLLCACARDAAMVALFLEEGAPLSLARTARGACCFEVATTALATLQELLLGGAEASVAHLLHNFREFFLVYNELLQADDYATKRQALSVLGRVLLSPGFGKVMSRYSSSALCLKVQMTLLLHPTAMVKVGAFHIFKIFVANPHKRPAVQEILYRNRDGLARLLRSLLREPCAVDDEDLREDLEAISFALADVRRPGAQENSDDGASAERPPLEAADGEAKVALAEPRPLGRSCSAGSIPRVESDLSAASTTARSDGSRARSDSGDSEQAAARAGSERPATPSEPDRSELDDKLRARSASPASAPPAVDC